MASSTAASDESLMRIALRIAERGLGASAPNPSVGAVIARDGDINARGWTQAGGRPHAETEALRRAGEVARGATMAVTLEPCSHHGRTPPCAESVVAAGIARVLVGAGDPDGRVAGRGIAMLRAAGIEVVEGVLAGEARRLTLGHILRVTAGRPFVQVKMALDEEGFVPRGQAGKPVWATGGLARAHGHLLRAEADAILVGRGTVADDDPELTCRLPGMAARSPVRIVLDTRLQISAASRLVRSSGHTPLWLVCGPEAGIEHEQELAGLGCTVIRVDQVESRIAVPALLRELAGRGITRLLVEGGAEVWRAFARAGAVDEVVLYHAGGGRAGSLGLGAEGRLSLDWYLSKAVSAGLSLAEARNLGPDRLTVFRAR